MGLPLAISCAHRSVSSPLLSGRERSSNTAATSRCTKEAPTLATLSTHSRWYSRFPAPASISRISRTSSGLSSTNRIFTRPESISSISPWGGSSPFWGTAVDILDMFMEGSPEFRHSLLWTAVFRNNKFLTAQRTLVDELLANFPRLYQKLRFFHRFVLHCKSPPAQPIRMARGGGVE